MAGATERAAMVRRSIGSVMGGVLLATAATVAVPPPLAASISAPTIFEYTGDPQYFTVPPGVTQITIDAYGASGGNAAAYFENDYHTSVTRGLGGWTRTEVEVTPGQVLQVNVGGAGGDGQIDEVFDGWRYTPGAGGDNGGGSGGEGQQAFTPPFPSREFVCAVVGGGGGGASDVRTGEYSLSERIVVGAGGGGTGGYFESYFMTSIDQFAFTAGGHGGGAVGADGVPSTDFFLPSLWQGTGGTPFMGGVFGGTAGAGGDGDGQAFTKGDCSAGAEGGGGGGLFGGGAGWGGGGGSAFPTTFTLPGIRDGNGLVVISYGDLPPPESPEPGPASTSTTQALATNPPLAALTNPPPAVQANPRFTG